MLCKGKHRPHAAAVYWCTEERLLASKVLPSRVFAVLNLCAHFGAVAVFLKITDDCNLCSRRGTFTLRLVVSLRLMDGATICYSRPHHSSLHLTSFFYIFVFGRNGSDFSSPVWWETLLGLLPLPSRTLPVVGQ